MNSYFRDLYFIALIFIISQSSTLLTAQNTWVEWNDESLTWLSGIANNSHEKDIAVSDLNNDGWTDVIVVQKAPFSNPGPRQDLLLMNNGSALADQTATYAPGFLSNPSDARDVFIGDFDDDGWDDVVIANTFGDQPIFYHNLGDDVNGNWLGLADESAARFPLPLNIPFLQFCAVWAGDIDDNGSLDIYFSNYGQNQGQGVSEDVLLINNGNGYFTDETDARMGNLRNSAFGTSVEIVDMDGDDDLDIVKISTLFGVSPWNDNAVLLLFNDGSGNFSNWQNLTPSGAPYMFTIGDFNENGLKDLYVVDDNSDYLLSVNSAIPDLSISFSTQISPDPRTVFFGGNCKLADLDKDGDLDVGIAGADVDIPPCQITGIRQFTMDRNNNGTLTAPYGAVNYPWNVSAYDFAFLDLDNDCFPDLFLGLCDGFQVFINQSENEPIEISGDTLICGNQFTTLAAPTGYASYSWSNGSNNSSISVNQQNTYCVTVTNEHGCTVEDCISVIKLTELSVEISGSPVFCVGESEVLTADTGFSTYLWSTNENSQSIEINQAGTYCVTVTDDFGCTGENCFAVSENPAISVNITGASMFCYNQPDTLFATTGFTNYLWSNGGTGIFTIANLTGTYCVTVTDNFGCTGFACAEVEELSEVVVSISGDEMICVEGVSTLAAQPGFSSYLWSTLETTPSIEVNQEGMYCLTVTDDFGCEGNACFTVSEHPQPVVNITGDGGFCPGNSATLIASEGFSAYLWSNGHTDSILVIDMAGSYCVTVTDEFGCEAETCITVSEHPQPLVNITGENEFCTGDSVTLSANGGFAAYLWSNGHTNSTLVVDLAGTYCVTITDANGCTAENCLAVVTHDPSFAEFTEFLCAGDTLELAGWIFTESGQYEIIFSNGNANGCDSLIELTLTFYPEIEIADVSITNDDGSGTGSIAIEPAGGTPPFVMTWSNGGSGTIISDLAFGDYTVEIKDVNGCTAVFTFMVELETSVAQDLKKDLRLKITPNPFSSATRLSYVLTSAVNIKIDILDSKGRFIETLFDGHRLPGAYTHEWQAETFPPGVYIISIRIDGVALTEQVVLVK